MDPKACIEGALDSGEWQAAARDYAEWRARGGFAAMVTFGGAAVAVDRVTYHSTRGARLHLTMPNGKRRIVRTSEVTL